MIIRGATVVTSSEVIEKADIAIADGLITDIGEDLGEEAEEIDATGLTVLPGGIDSHVHFNEPGRTEWEDIAHGSAALAAGGYTGFIDMPLNNLPVTTTVEAFDLKLAAMERSATIDFGLWGGLVPDNLDDLEQLVRRGVMGFKAFMCPSGIDQFPACDEATLREGMIRIAELDSILLVHAEDPRFLRETKGPTARDYLESRPVEAEVSAIAMAIAMARESGCRLHVVHVSTAAGAGLVDKARREGVDVSGETCPHYMLYAAHDLERLGGLGKCAPPFRDKPVKAMPIVVSDHSPSTLALKEGDDFRMIWGGISGCQSTRQLLLAQEGVDVLEATIATSTNVARRFRIEGKGNIAPGYDADLWLVDLGWHGIVEREDLLYKNRFSAHEGRPIRGKTIRTIRRGAPRLMRPGARR